MKKFIVCVVSFVLVLFFEIGGVCAAVASNTQRMAVDDTKYCAAIIENRIIETLDLLNSLAATSLFQNTDMSYLDKAIALTKISDEFDYMMVRVLDADFNVYSENTTNASGISSNLAGRDYLQTLKRTLEPQITDIFLAGADGRTVNFTVAVPIAENGVFKGALFAAIYETDFATLLKENHSFLLGSNLQYMSGIESEDVGELLGTVFEDIWLWGANMEDRLLEIKRASSYSGCFWGMTGADIEAISYSKVANTNWNVMSRITFADAIGEMPVMFSLMILAIGVTTFLFVCAIVCRRRFFVELPPLAPDDDDDIEDDDEF